MMVFYMIVEITQHVLTQQIAIQQVTQICVDIQMVVIQLVEAESEAAANRILDWTLKEGPFKVLF